MHFSVEITVGYEQVAGAGMDCQVRALVERLTTQRLGWFSPDTEGHQHLSIQSALSHGMVEGVGQPDSIIGAHGNGVGVGKHFLVAPAVKKIALTVQDNDRMLAAVEQVDIVAGVN